MSADALTLVLLPGMDGTDRLFAPLIEALGPDVRVQVIRYATTSTAGYRELTDFVRQALPAKGEYVLLGESFSGPIAVSIAAQAPPGLKALVLCCTFVSNPRPGLAPFRPLLPLVPLCAHHRRANTEITT
jgi:pimeloyl-[acyl-carrier protein] methyl ester esterase